MLSVVIPIFNLDSERKRNLEFVYDRLCSASFKIFFAIQDEIVDLYYKKFNNVEIIHVYEKSFKNFNKGFILNCCLKKGFDTKFIMFLDSDVYFSFKDLENEINKNDEVIKPHAEIVYLDNLATNDFLEKRKTTASPMFKRKSNDLLSGALILNQDLFQKKEIKFSENFQSDFENYLKLKNISVRTIDRLAIHLYHNISSLVNFNNKIIHIFNSDNESKISSYIKNKKNYVKLVNLSDSDVIKNENVKFIKIHKEGETYSLNEMIKKSLELASDNDWILYTDSSYSMTEYLYRDLLNYAGAYCEFYGCLIDSSGRYVSTNTNIDGFAIKKSVLVDYNTPKIFINSPYWGNIISKTFEGLDKKEFENQLRSSSQKHFDLNKLNFSGSVNLSSYEKAIQKIKNKTKYDITLITPTGGRKEALSLCEKYIKRNKTDLSVQWIIVNDFDDAEYEFATDMIFTKKKGNSIKNSLGKSVKEAIKYVNSNYVLFIEDDDWYAPDYIEYYYNMLQKADIVGQGFAKFYNVKNRTYEIRTNYTSASLCQTGIRTKLLLENINCFNEKYSPFHDDLLWSSITNASKMLESTSNKCIGIKGMPSLRKAMGCGHDYLTFEDKDLSVLRGWIGSDADGYEDIEFGYSKKEKGFLIETPIANNNHEVFYNTKNILYFAPCAPDYDLSSGGDRLLKILQILKEELNYNVFFFCNYFIDKKHIDLLENLGIKCFTPEDNSYLLGHLERLKNQHHFDYVFFSWYDIATQYLKIVKKLFPKIKVITDTVDLHWIRETRGVKEGELNYTNQELQQRKNQEKNIYAESDVIYAVTNSDKEEIIKELGFRNIKLLSNIHDIKENKELGNDIIFIGNFKHNPNIQAALDSIKIYEKFTRTDAYLSLANKPKLYIVGKNAPESIINAARSVAGCEFLGYVEDLDSVYNKIKISISPLKWGAGIKGKICDAASRGVLILTSDVGNEGIDLEHKSSAFISNSEDEFLSSLISIYSMNKKEISKIAERGKKVVNALVSHEAAVSCLKHTLCAKPIAIVVVTYNKAKMLQNCLFSILNKTKYPNYKIIVIDNNSQDETEQTIKEIESNNPGKIDYYKNENNEFFIIPNNKIMKNEKYKDFDVVLINDDTEVKSECWLSHLYSTAYSEYDVCCVGGKILYPDETIAEAGAELYNDGTGRNLGRGLNSNICSFNVPRYTGYVSGCFMYMRRDAIEKIGVFDEDLVPMYYEDSEWQYRGHVNGLKTIYQPKATMIHYEGKDESKSMKKYQHINREKFVAKYSGLNIEQYNHKIPENLLFYSDWNSVAMKAMKIGFDDEGKIDFTKSHEESIKLLYEAISLKPNKSWPYIKLADSIIDLDEKLRLYNESIEVEPTLLAKAAIYDIYLLKIKLQEEKENV